jgi:hypothetical protein
MKRLLFFITSLLLITACNDDPLKVEVEQVELPHFETQRLENELFAMNAANLQAASQKLSQKYGPVFNHYIMSFVHQPGINDTGYAAAVLRYITDKDVKECYQMVASKYTADRMGEISVGLEEMIKRFKIHFPEKKLPKRLLTTTTGWNYAFAYMDTTFLLGLDMYLGDTCKFYQMLQYPLYQSRKMNEHYILPDIARGWLLTEFDNANAENNLLSYTVFYGKLFYAIEALLPEAQDSVIIGYSSPQMKYLERYEKELWGYFSAKNRLYETNLNTVRELTSEGPFTAAISRECPPRIAMWVGWQIVRSYMKRHPEIKLQDLMKDKDAAKIVSQSKYRP